MTSLIDHTHLLGTTALVVAALAAAARWRRRWAVLAALLLAMAFAIVTDAGWAVHAAADRVLITTGLYPRRFEIQSALVAVAVTALLATVALAWRQGEARGRWMAAMLATAALVGLFLVQFVSLHAVDAVLGRRVGPVMLVGWLWLGGAGAVIIAAWADRRETPE